MALISEVMRSFVGGPTNRSLHNKAMHTCNVKKGFYAIKRSFAMTVIITVTFDFSWLSIAIWTGHADLQPIFHRSIRESKHIMLPLVPTERVKNAYQPVPSNPKCERVDFRLSLSPRTCSPHQSQNHPICHEAFPTAIQPKETLGWTREWPWSGSVWEEWTRTSILGKLPWTDIPSQSLCHQLSLALHTLDTYLQ